MHVMARCLIGLYQLIGGLAGVGVMAWAVSSQQMALGNWVSSVLPLTLFVLGVVSGWMLLRKRQKSITLSYLYQAAQVVSFSTPLSTYSLSAGARIGPYFGEEVGFYRLFGIHYEIHLLSIDRAAATIDSSVSAALLHNSTIGVNLLAGAIILYIRYCAHRSSKLYPYMGFQFSQRREAAANQAE